MVNVVAATASTQEIPLCRKGVPINSKPTSRTGERTCETTSAILPASEWLVAGG